MIRHWCLDKNPWSNDMEFRNSAEWKQLTDYIKSLKDQLHEQNSVCIIMYNPTTHNWCWREEKGRSSWANRSINFEQ